MLKFKLDQVYPTIVRYVLEKRGWVKVANNDNSFDLYWRNGRFHQHEIEACGPRQRFNHFLKSGLITRKAGTIHYLKLMRREYGDIFDFTPASFIVNQDTAESIKAQLSESTKNRMWIIKPSNGSQGRGIKIIKSLNDMVLKDSDRIYLAQLYMKNPLLIAGYKFDLRIYVLVSSFHPMTIYLYKEGLCRFATKPYDTELSFDEYGKMDSYKHLTNTSINKHSPIFFSTSNTNKILHEGSNNTEFNRDITEALGLGSQSRRTLRQLICYLNRQGIDYRPLWREIEKIILLTLLPLGQYVPQTESRCFELYGFDIMIDDQLKPWLIEVNFSPSLGADTATDQTIKESLIEDLLDTLDFKPYSQNKSNSNMFQSEEYYEEFADFLSRTPSNRRDLAFPLGGVGNFECIFPFDMDTLVMAKNYAEQKDVETYRSMIVNAIRQKYSNFRCV